MATRAIIFDWDDTICPSTLIDKLSRLRGIKDISSLDDVTISTLQAIERTSIKLLTSASNLGGPVILITNSEDGWVKYSAERFLPGLLPILSSPHIQIVSARSLYERTYPGQPLCWKSAAFARECKDRFFGDSNLSSLQSLHSTSFSSSDEEIFPSSPPTSHPPSAPSPPSPLPPQTEILSIGDSPEEKTATIIVANQLNAVPKTIKMLQSPTPLQILGQLELVHQYLHELVSNEGPLDIVLSEEQTKRCIEWYMTTQPPAIAASMGFASPPPPAAAARSRVSPIAVSPFHTRSPLSNIDLNGLNRLDGTATATMAAATTTTTIPTPATQPLPIPTDDKRGAFRSHQRNQQQQQQHVVTPDKLAGGGGAPTLLR